MHPLCWAVCGEGETRPTLTVWVSNWVACRWCGVILLPVVPGPSCPEPGSDVSCRGGGVVLSALTPRQVSGCQGDFYFI